VTAFLRLLGRGLQLLLGFGLLAWAALAVHFQLDGSLALLGFTALGVAGLMLAYLASHGKWRGVWRWTGLCALLVGGWWMTVRASDNRDWMAEVSRGVTAEPVAAGLLLRDIRNFDWTSETAATPGWYDAVVDPEKIVSVDMFLSIWDHPDIAHTLVSFGFEDGQHIVFSAETRKETGESYSTLGGFFRQYELVLIAADERDILRLRTDLRHEQVSRYPIDLSPDMRKTLFMAFVDYGNDLATNPRWYNSLTTNCTTVPYQMITRFTDKVRPDLRILLAGRLPEYLHEIGVLAPGQDMAEVRRRARLGLLGPGGPDGKAFSRALRAASAE
jgi:hypothetical protein